MVVNQVQIVCEYKIKNVISPSRGLDDLVQEIFFSKLQESKSLSSVFPKVTMITTLLYKTQFICNERGFQEGSNLRLGLDDSNRCIKSDSKLILAKDRPSIMTPRANLPEEEIMRVN